MNVHFSSKTDEWATPQEFFDALNKEFRFNLDPCADKKNAKCKNFFTKKQDGLMQSWKGKRIFCNPPYGRVIGDWVKKCATGGGYGNSCTTSRAYRYALVPRIYIRKGRDPIHKRTAQIWRSYQQRTIPFNGGYLAMI